MDTECRCSFCCQNPIDVTNAIHHEIPICGLSKIDGKYHTFMWFGGRKCTVKTQEGEYPDMLSVCTRFSIDSANLYLRDINCGCIPINCVKSKLAWGPMNKVQVVTKNVGVCEGHWIPVDIPTLLTLCPEYKALFKVDNNKKRSNIAKDSIEVDGFDPHTTRPCYWTSGNLSKFLNRHNRSLSLHLDPVLESITDIEIDLNGAPKYKCVFLHSDGSFIELWLPYGDLCLNRTYLSICQKYQKSLMQIETSWDTFDPNAD